ncbi:MAG: inorganic phosphate transporter [Acidimicrobiales bacterium]
MTVAILVLVVGLAAANGSNDVPKGVATLAGAGVTRYRTAIVWGTVATLGGSLVSLQLADRLAELFSTGTVTATPTPAFALAVLAGTAAWVAFATATKLPVSTTHAIVGSLVGAGLLLTAGAVNFEALPTRVAVPLLLGVGVAYLVSMVLNLLPQRIPECVCLSLENPVVAPVVDPQAAGVLAAPVSLPIPKVTTGTMADCGVHGSSSGRLGFTVNGAHWLSSGATSFARGLNDTPKIVAVGAFALVPAGMTIHQILVVVAAAMAAGSILGGMRIAHRLGEGVVKMSHVEGFRANLTTALLVGFAANRGLPLSTTHVSTGAIAGAAGKDTSRLHTRTLRDFLIAWTLTPLIAGALAAAIFAVFR